MLKISVKRLSLSGTLIFVFASGVYADSLSSPTEREQSRSNQHQSTKLGDAQKAEADVQRQFNLEATFNTHLDEHASRQFVFLDNDHLLNPDKSDLNKNNAPTITAHLNTSLPKINFIEFARQEVGKIVAVDEKVADRFIHAISCDFDQFNGKEIAACFNKVGVVASRDERAIDCLQLLSGNIVFSPRNHITVRLPEGILQIAGGSIVLVMKQSDFLAVYDLHQPKVSAVQVIANKKVIELHPGLLVALPKQNMDNFDSFNKNSLDDIAYRNANVLDFGNETKGFIAEFSIPSAMAKTIPLREMVRSHNEQDRSKIDKLLTDSVALMEATSYAGPYHCSEQ